MKISTRGRYALRVMIELAKADGARIPMKTLAQQLDISLKYLERIFPVLVKHRLVDGVQGKGGGYRLCRPPKDYKVGEILQLTEGCLLPVNCLDPENHPCSKADSCPTIKMWAGLYRQIYLYLDSITLEDLLPGSKHQF